MKNFLTILFSAYCVCVWSQVSAPKYSNEFLSLGIGGRSISMSESVVSSTNGAYSGILNPAALVSQELNQEVALMHAEYFAGIAQYDYVGYSTKIDSSRVLGFSLVRFGVDDIPDTRYLFDANGAINYDNITFFSASDYAFFLSYAQKSKIEGLSYGGNLKVIYRQVGEFATAWGVGFDAGVRFKRKWNYGILLRDVTSTYTNWFVNNQLLEETFLLTGNEIPENSVEVTLPRLIAGVSRDIVIKNKFGMLGELGFDCTFDGRRNTLLRTDFASIDPHIGLEFDYNKIVYLRFGFGDIQQIEDFDESLSWTVQPNFGVGVKIKRFRLDYALTDIGNQSDALFSNIFSVSLNFNEI